MNWSTIGRMEWDFHLFISTFSLIFLAELPDKTAFATLLMATRKHPVAVFAGVAGAFLVQSLFAVLFGGILGFFPDYVLKIGAALMFFAFAWMSFRRGESQEEQKIQTTQESRNFFPTVWSSFVVIFIAEWGDITQLSTATLCAHYKKPLTIFVGATLALWSVTAVMILIGHRAKDWVRPKLLNRIAAIAFTLVGILMLVGLFK